MSGEKGVLDPPPSPKGVQNAQIIIKNYQGVLPHVLKMPFPQNTPHGDDHFKMKPVFAETICVRTTSFTNNESFVVEW